MSPPLFFFKSLFLLATRQRVKALDAKGVLEFWQNPKIPEFWKGVFSKVREGNVEEARALLVSLC